MYLLDTDAANALLRGHPGLSARVRATPPDRLWLSAIAAEEMLQGRMAAINTERSKKRGDLGQAYRHLIGLLSDLSRFQILPYDDACEAFFKQLPASVRRVRANDCRVACQAVVYELTVVTYNLRDFSRIPKVRFEDWTQ